MSGLSQYLVKRLGYTSVTLALVSLLIFVITMVLPGNAAVMMLGQHATEERVATLEDNLGLNEPLHTQYINWVTGILQGDLGTSLVFNQPIIELLIPRLIRSAQLALVTLAFISIFGIGLGVLAAVRRDSLVDRIITTTTYIGVGIPEFVSGVLLLILFAGPVFNLLPAGGYSSMTDGLVEWARHIILPSISLTLVLLAHVMRQTRSEMISTLESEYVRTARLKGQREYVVVLKHAIRNGLLPTITVIALSTGWLMGGIVVVEEVFAYPGLGALVVTAIESRDIPLIQITVLIIAATYAFANLAADIVYTFLDPRIEYGGGQ